MDEVQNSAETNSVPATGAGGSNSQNDGKKKMSTGAKVAIGCGIGCVALIIIFGILIFVFPVVIINLLPDDFTSGMLEEWMEENSDSEVDVEVDDEEWTFSDDEGSYSYGEDLELPSDFPSDVSVYIGVTVVSTSASEGSTMVTFQTTATVKEVSEYYKSNFENDGWTVETESSTTYDGGRTDLFTFSKEGREISMGIYSGYGDEYNSFYILY